MNPGAGPAIFVVFAILVIGIAVVAYLANAKRKEEAQILAASLGLQWDPNDSLGISRRPHPFFRLGDTQRASNVVSGVLDGTPLALFDYEYTEYRTDAEGRRTSTTSSFSGVLATLDARCPRTVIRRERMTTKLANALGMGRDIHFESDEFNRAFEVRSGSQQFAFTLIDPAMMEWLIANARDLEIQFEGSELLWITHRLPWTDMEALARGVIEFKAQFPRLVWDSYGSGA